MLKVVKQTMESLPSENFGKFYQEYIVGLEDEIIDHDINLATSEFKSIEDVNEVVKGINKLTQELNKR